MIARVKLMPPVATDLVNKTLPIFVITSSVETAPMETIIVTGSCGLVKARERANDSLSRKAAVNPASFATVRYLSITLKGAATKRTCILSLPELSGLETTLYCKFTSFIGRGIYCSASQLMAAESSLSVRGGSSISLVTTCDSKRETAHLLLPIFASSTHLPIESASFLRSIGDSDIMPPAGD